MDINIRSIGVVRNAHQSLNIEGMMSMMMRSYFSEPLGGVVSGAIFGACPGSTGTVSA